LASKPALEQRHELELVHVLQLAQPCPHDVQMMLGNVGSGDGGHDDHGVHGGGDGVVPRHGRQRGVDRV
jgi:hypothetical protein